MQKPSDQTQCLTKKPQSGAVLPSGVANTLWDRALASLDPKKKKSLQIDEGTSQLNIDSIIEEAGSKRDQCVEKRWKFWIVDMKFDLSEKAERIIACLNKLKEIGDVAVQYSPGRAALPWAAIRLVLQVR